MLDAKSDERVAGDALVGSARPGALVWTTVSEDAQYPS